MSTIKISMDQRIFVFRVLSGVAIGIVAGLVPNAILGEILNTLCNIILFSKLY